MSGIFCTGFSGCCSEFVTALSPPGDGAVTCSARSALLQFCPALSLSAGVLSFARAIVILFPQGTGARLTRNHQARFLSLLGERLRALFTLLQQPYHISSARGACVKWK